jgi:hypothetical protein
MLVHSVDPNGRRGIEVERLSTGEVVFAPSIVAGATTPCRETGPAKPGQDSHVSTLQDAQHLLA